MDNWLAKWDIWSELVFYNNRVEQWVEALIIIAVVWFVFNVLKGFFVHHFSRLAEKTATDFDDMIAGLLESTKPFLPVALALYSTNFVLTLEKEPEHILNILPILALLLQIAFWGNAVIGYFIAKYVNSRQTEEEKIQLQTMSGPLKAVGLFVLWSILVIVALDNMNVDITGFVAGLGIGGVAVALAVQNILGDLFASLSIVVDRPFVVGDFVIIDDYMGNIEHIGLKTTRIRSLGGEQLVFSNSDLLSSRIRNYKRMERRRVVFAFGVIYQTTPEQMDKIPGMVQEIIEKIDNTTFDRCHFKSFGDSSLDFETVYYVEVSDYNVYMDIQQSINMAIFRQFATEGLDFAYPTRTLFVTDETPLPDKGVKLK